MTDSKSPDSLVLSGLLGEGLGVSVMLELLVAERDETFNSVE